MIYEDDIFTELGILVEPPKQFKTLPKISDVQGLVSEAEIIIHCPI